MLLIRARLRPGRAAPSGLSGHTPGGADRPRPGIYVHVNRPAARMEWLDALRGFAALTVVCFHFSPLLLPEAQRLRDTG